MIENNFFTNICRVCTKSSMSLFSLYEDEEDGISSIEKLKAICGLEINENDDYPKTICKVCRRKLNTYYEFRIMCLTSQEKLNNYSIKDETIDNFVEINGYDYEEEIRYFIELEEDYTNDDDLLLSDIEQYFKTSEVATTNEVVVPKIVEPKIVKPKPKKLKKSETHDPNKKFKCKVCKKRFSSELRVKLHMQRIHKQIYLSECKVTCPKCGMKFQHIRNLKRHLVYHNTDSYFGCEFCDKKSYSKKSWRKHIKVHDEKINVICKICNKTILSKLSNIYHMEYHHTKEILAKKILYNCFTCQTDFEHFDDLQKHCGDEHCLKTPFEHDYSNENLNTLNDKFDEVERNVERIFSETNNDTNLTYKPQNIDTNLTYKPLNHDTNLTYKPQNNDTNLTYKPQNNDTNLTYKPQNIDTNLTSKLQNIDTNLTYKLQNLNASVTFKCNICSRFYKNLPDLKYHVEECYAKVNRPKSFMCDVCGKCFSSAWTLTNHKAGHSTARPFICDTCGQRFKWHNDLSNHKSRIHDKVRPYVCKICGKKCGTSATLKSHTRLHTGEKPYICSVCGAKFSQNSSLKEHSFKHTGGANVSCPVCHKVFQTPLRLRTHLKRHNTHRQLFPCDKCGRMFTEKSSVRKHVMKIHSGEQCSGE